MWRMDIMSGRPSTDTKSRDLNPQPDSFCASVFPSVKRTWLTSALTFQSFGPWQRLPAWSPCCPWAWWPCHFPHFPTLHLGAPDPRFLPGMWSFKDTTAAWNDTYIWQCWCWFPHACDESMKDNLKRERGMRQRNGFQRKRQGGLGNDPVPVFSTSGLFVLFCKIPWYCMHLTFFFFFLMKASFSGFLFPVTEKEWPGWYM